MNKTANVLSVIVLALFAVFVTAPFYNPNVGVVAGSLAFMGVIVVNYIRDREPLYGKARR